MSDIYANGYLNIAATHASDGHGGLFFERWTPSFHKRPQDRRKRSVTSHTIPLEAGGDLFVRHNLGYYAHTDVTMINVEQSDYDMVKSAPLLTRGWAYQERLLSPRTISFHGAEMIWDCGKGFSCECGQLIYERDFGRVPPKFLFVIPREEEATSDIFSYWYDMVGQFSRLKLTVPTDKLPALSGVAHRISQIIKSDYLAGLWSDDMIRGLLWRAKSFFYGIHTSHPSRRAKPYRAPTWSWASIDLSDEPLADRPSTTFNSYISYQFADSVSRSNDSGASGRFTVLEADCQVHGANPYGRVMSGHILARGPIIATILHYKDRDERKRYRNTWRQYPFGLTISNSASRNNYWFDFNVRDEGDEHIPEGSTILAMFITSTKYGFGYVTDFAILLVASKRKPGKYERVGILEAEDRLFVGAEVMTLDII
jgi:hypothetical protein